MLPPAAQERHHCIRVEGEGREGRKEEIREEASGGRCSREGKEEVCKSKEKKKRKEGEREGNKEGGKRRAREGNEGVSKREGGGRERRR